MSPSYSAGYPVHDLLSTSLCSVTAPLHSPPYDVRGRQQHFVETAQQRNARLEFVKKREWARRVAEWIRETSARQDVMTFGCTGSLAASSSRSDHVNAHRCTTSSPLPLPPRDEEEEPYVIYSSSPSSSMSSLSDDLSASSTPAPLSSISIHSPSNTIPTPSKRAQHRRRSSAGLANLRRRPSLSSICEVPEED